MTAKLKSSTSSAQQPAESRTFYWLTELIESKTLNKKHNTVHDLLNYAATEKLALSFVVAGKTTLSGTYDSETGAESIETCDVSLHSGLVPLLTEYVWQIIAEKVAVVEYTHKTDTSFTKIEKTDDQPLPAVSLENVVVKVRDWERFVNGMLPDTESQNEQEISGLSHNPKVAAGLALMYARESNQLKDGKINKADILKDFTMTFADSNGIYPPGMSQASFYKALVPLDTLLSLIASKQSK